jgi:Stress responsive A/B Barrel Domain
MIRHILLINWKADADPAHIEDAIARSVALRSLECIAALGSGSKLGLVDDSYDFAVTIDFESLQQWQAYQQDPMHRAAAAVVRPLVASLARIQFSLD